MKKTGVIFQRILIGISICFTVLSVILFFVFILNKQFFPFSGVLDVELAANYGTFFQGLVGTSVGISGSLWVIFVFLQQRKQERISQLENIFYKMLDFHRENVNSIIEKAQAFVSFQSQLFYYINMVSELNVKLDRKLNKTEIVDAAYMIFYYGVDVDRELNDFTKNLLKNYDEKLPELIYKHIETKKTNASTIEESKYLGKSNQTILSVYFRNMYNAIMLIHKSDFLTDDQKRQYIKIFRAQLSNPELVVLFFNVMSRFGKKWKENNIIIKYSFIKNLPANTCNGYNPKEYFLMEYEEDEIGV